MPQKYNIVLFFDTKKLDAPQRFDPSARLGFLQKGMQAIRHTISGVELGEPLISSFSVPANVTGDQLQDLLDLMSKNEFGEVFCDGEILQAAR